MYHVPRLIHVSVFLPVRKRSVDFVSERIKLVHGIKNTRLAFQTSKTTIKVKLKSISKFQLLFHCRNFEKYMIFYTLPWSRWNRTHKLWNMCVVPFTIAELSQKCLEAAPTLNMNPETTPSLYLAFESWRYLNVMLLNTFSRNKRRKNCEEYRWRSLSAPVWPYAMSLTVRCQNLIGSYASTHSTFNLIGPCIKHPNTQSRKATKIRALKPLTYELFFQNSSTKD